MCSERHVSRNTGAPRSSVPRKNTAFLCREQDVSSALRLAQPNSAPLDLDSRGGLFDQLDQSHQAALLQECSSRLLVIADQSRNCADRFGHDFHIVCQATAGELHLMKCQRVAPLFGEAGSSHRCSRIGSRPCCSASDWLKGLFERIVTNTARIKGSNERERPTQQRCQHCAVRHRIEAYRLLSWSTIG